MPASAKGVRAGKSFVELGVNDKVTRALRRLERRFKAFGNAVRKVGLGMAKVGAIAAAGLGLALRPFVKFDDTMRSVGAVVGATREQFQALREEAKRLGAETSFSASQVAGAMLELGRAGFDSGAILASIANVLDLARATGTDLPRAAEIAGAALRGFGLDADEMGRVADVLTATANKSAQTLEDLFESLKVVAPIASAAGESIEDIAAALGVLANNGIKGSLAGNAIARAYKNLSNEATRASLAAKGVTVVDGAGDLRSLADIINDIADATAGLGSADRLAFFEELFGRGQAAALKLAESGEAARELADALRAAGGDASRVAKEMDAGIGGALRRFLSAAEGIAIAIGDALAPTLIEWADGLSAIAGLIKRVVSNNSELFTRLLKIIAVVSAVGAALFVLGAAVTIAGIAIGGLVTLVTGAISTIALLVSPIGLLIGAIVALGVTVVRSTDVAGMAVQWLQNTFGGLLQTVKDVVGAIVNALQRGDTEAAGRVLMASLKLVWESGLAAIETAFADFWGRLRRQWVEAKAAFKSIWLSMKNDAVNVWDTVVNEVAKALTGLFLEDELVGEARKQLDAELAANKARRKRETEEELQRVERDRQQQLREVDEASEERRLKAAEDLAAAQEDLNKAIKEANRQDEEGEQNQEGTAEPRGSGIVADDLLETLELGVARAATAAAGTFNTRALQSLQTGVSGFETKALGLLEGLKRDTRKVVENTRGSGGVPVT